MHAVDSVKESLLLIAYSVWLFFSFPILGIYIIRLGLGAVGAEMLKARQEDSLNSTVKGGVCLSKYVCDFV